MCVNSLAVLIWDRFGADEVRQVCCVLKRDLARFFDDLSLFARGKNILSRSSTGQ